MTQQRHDPVLHAYVVRVCGYTLIELLVVMLLMSIFATMGAPHFFRWLQQYRLHAAVTVMMNHFRATRLLAVYKGVPHQVQVTNVQNGNYYQVVEDPGGADTIVSTIGRVLMNSRYGGVRIVRIPASGRITFSPRGTARNASIVLENPSGTRIKVVINTFGRVKREYL
jgi:prepilin-type N-terminal cleavage/methylation domain-containing protein